jgi:hypothetical protein
MMDFWYERVIREMIDINEEATELLKKAEQTERLKQAEHDSSRPAEQADEEHQ